LKKLVSSSLQKHVKNTADTFEIKIPSQDFHPSEKDFYALFCLQLNKGERNEQFFTAS